MLELRTARIVPNVVLMLLVGCHGKPGADAKTASEDVAPATTPSTVTPPTGASASHVATSHASTPLPLDEPPVAGGAGSAPTSADSPASPLLDTDGNPLPQTDDRPSATSAPLQRRLEALVRAIAENKPALALPSFFPVEAYKQVKAIAKPERDWQRRLVAAFERNIGKYHRKLGSAAAGIRFVRLDVPEAKVKWMKPGSEGNRVGYFRVVRSNLVVAKTDGTEVAFEVTSMISWRGEWYVVHLNGFE